MSRSELVFLARDVAGADWARTGGRRCGPLNHDMRTSVRQRRDPGRTVASWRAYPLTPARRFDSTAARDGGVPMSTILIVANQTLPSEALATEVTSRIASGARDFHIVVPAT